MIGVFLVLVVIFSCKEVSENPNVTLVNETNIGYAVSVSMEDETFRIAQENLESPIVVIKKDTLQFSLWEDGNPLQLNFNLNNTAILSSGSATYAIPDVNAPKIKVDLSFFNKDRDVKRTNKRIIFRKGTIHITKITEHELQMTFEGEGSGILEYGKNFSISGNVKISY